MTEIYAWHFARADGVLGYDDGRKIIVGETLRVDPPIELCERGLHASRRAIDALKYAPGPLVCYVRLSGEIKEGIDKCVATERTVIAMADATDMLLAMSRWSALQVIHLWGAPAVVRQFLETGDESLRDAARVVAWAAAWDAAKDAAGDAARAAARAAARDAARDAAVAAARDAARAAARDAALASAWAAARAAAWDSAWDPAWDPAWDAAGAAARDAAVAAARAAQNTELERRLRELLAIDAARVGKHG